MPSDSFWSELGNLRPDEFQSALSRYVTERFPETQLRQEAIDRLFVSLATLRGTDAESEEAVEFLRAGEFLRVVGVPPKMLVDRILPDKSLILLSGKPKAGKSLAALDMLDAVCQGKPVWGQFAVNHPGPVFYLGMEDGKYEIANRLLARGLRIGDERPFYISPHRLNLSKRGSVALLKQLLEKTGEQPVLLCIDTAREALGIQDWSNAAEVVDKVRPLRDLSRELCSILLVTHNRKAEAIDAGDEIAGTNAFTGAVDGWLSAYKFLKTKEQHRLWLRVDGRGGMREEFILEMALPSLNWRALTEEEMIQEQRKAQAQLRKEQFHHLIQIVEQMGGKATVGQIAEGAGLEFRNTRNIIDEMVRKNYLTTNGERFQPAGAGRPAPYYVPGAAISELWNYGKTNIGSTEKEIIPNSDEDPEENYGEEIL